MKAPTTASISRLSLSVRGVVQGVGFRPFVYQLAARHHLKGWVCNTSGEVRIEVEGESPVLDRFVRELQTQAPPLAHIEDVSVTQGIPEGYDRFEIRESIPEEDKYQLVSPDIATCPACLAEVFSPEDRRHRYPFTNCTNCGPRFTIIADIPYDRPLTTMCSFRMCPECQREYDDPLDRRFHAQPNACPKCGPQLELVGKRGRCIEGDALSNASRLLREGSVLAVKGLGGFLLACDATNEQAVLLLRERKRRPGKPFAVMLASLEEVREHCQVSPVEEELLSSHQSPIVLLRWRPDSSIAREVAPGLKYLGAMLPYTPLHHLLCREAGRPLVMTSGNLTEEPIAKDNDEAMLRLGGIADCFLWHNRDIYARYDDSVTMVELDRPQVLRRARGYAPFPIHLPFQAGPVLACGAELKSTFCLTRDGYAFLSQHIGDLENLSTLEHFQDTIGLYQRLFRIHPEIIACDMHPEYLSTKYAKERAESQNIPLVPVQHHHAHIVSGMVDNGLNEPVLGVALDGTGYGTDGDIWGGEFLLSDYVKFERLGHLEYVPLPGGAAAIERPYRMAVSYLATLLGEDSLSSLPFLGQVDEQELRLLLRQLERKINSPLTSSAGRLFDGVSALLGIRGRVDYEAQAAIELQMLANESETGSYPFTITEEDGTSVVRLKELFVAILADMRGKVPTSVISARFHNTAARMIAEMCLLLSRKTGIKKVVLSGGVFQNRLLLRNTVAALEGEGLKAFTHREVPANDGGVSLGQAVIANFREKVV